jgi:methylaspartate ammonia-lyase
MGVRLLEKDALPSDAKYKLIIAVRLDLTQMLDEVDGFAPTQIVGQLAVDKILVQRIEVLAHSVFSFTNNSKLE